ncbi:MAG: metal-dependent hydrolase [Candidatus Heimdallarchaeota archaeon]|nr:metal-dependent hydrolase [Candidatus Heimdallarchaeota archaeon]
MPGKIIHIVFGEIIGLPLVGIMYYSFSSDFNYFMLALILAASLVCVFIGAILPDLLERPTNPNHRKFLHSWFVFAIAFIASFVMALVIIPLYEHLFFVYPIFGFCLGYFSHLLLDSTTKRSLT